MVLFLSFLILGGSAWADDFDTARNQWLVIQTGGANNMSDADVASAVNSLTAKANNYWTSMNKTDPRTCLWNDLSNFGVSSTVTNTYTRLKTMATAYATNGSTLQGNAQLAQDIVNGLDWMNANYYNATATEYGNWWDWEIGSPQALGNTALMVYSSLSSTEIANYTAAIDHFLPDPTKRLSGVTETGANLLDKCLAVILRGILGKSSAKIGQGHDDISGVFPNVTGSDGFYADGSFIQHTDVAYTGEYGGVVLTDIANLLTLLNNSAWPITDPNQSIVWNEWVPMAYRPLLYHDAMMDMVRGRAISRSGSTDHGVGRGDVFSLAVLAQAAPSAQAATIQSIVKSQVAEETSIGNYYAYSNVYGINLIKGIMANSSITAQPDPVAAYNYGSMARFVHLRSNFGFGLSLCSSRIVAYELGNGENSLPWYTGLGMTYLYNADLAQFDGAFWPTVNALRLPGTTTDGSNKALPKDWTAVFNPNTWVGGSTVDGLYGSAGMQFALTSITGSPLQGYKSWFFFANKVVALGAGISSTSSAPVETIVDNRRLTSAGTNAFVLNGTAQPTTVGWTANFRGVTWAYLDGNVANSGIGYYFPGSTSLYCQRESRSGAWCNLNLSGAATVYTNNYLNLAIEHGTQPTSGTYAYALLPNQTQAGMATYATNPDFVVLHNGTDAQAVLDTSTGVTGANFWGNASTTVNDESGAPLINSLQKASVTMVESGGELDVGVSDPTQANTGTITVTIYRTAGAVISSDTQVTVTQLTPNIVLSVNVNGAAGASFSAKFAESTPVAPIAPANLSAVAGDGQTTLSWSAVSGATSYNVKRGTTSGGPYATIASPAAASYGLTDTGLTDGTPYYYVVTASNAGGESGNSVEASATPAAATLAPAPQGVTAIGGNGQVALNWNASAGASSYNIKRATVSGGPYTVVGSSGSTSYTDATTTNGTTYFYVLTAVNGSGEGAASNEVGTTPTLGRVAAPTFSATSGAYVSPQTITIGTTTPGATIRYTVDGTVPTETVGTVYTGPVTIGVNTNIWTTLRAVAYESGYTDSVVTGSTYNILPAPPVTLTATAGTGQVALSWTSSTGASGYNVKYSITSGGPYTTLAGGVTGTTYTDTTCTGGTTYYYVVSAINGGGEGLNSNEASATPAAGETEASAADAYVRDGTYTNTNYGTATTMAVKCDATGYNRKSYITFNLTNVHSVNSATLQVYAASVNTDASRTISVYAITPSAWTETGITWNNAPAAGTFLGSFNVSNVAGAWYYFDVSNYVQSQQTGGATQVSFLLINNGPASGTSDVSFATKEASTGKPLLVVTPVPVPSAPGGLAATPGNAQVSLNWGSVSGATSYNVKSATTSGGPYTTVATGVTGTTYTNTGLANGTTYYYVVSAMNAGGEGANSSEANATPVAAPNPPTNLVASAGNAQVSLTWIASSGATSYNVKQATTSGGPYTAIATGVTATSYTNTGLTNGTTYYYVVSAVDAGGESANSTEAGATPVAPPAAPTNLAATAGNAQVSLAWTAATGAASYNVKRATTTGGPYANVATGITTTSYNDTGLTNGTTYFYVVSAVNAGGESGNSTEANATPLAPPPAPTGLTATAGNAQASLSWSASTGAISYNVKRSTTSGGPYTTIASNVSGTTYTNTGLNNGTKYYYVVSAVGTTGEGANSSEANAALPATLGTTADSYVRDGTYTSTNYGAATIMTVKCDATGYNRKAYLTFDTTSATSVTGAIVKLYVPSVDTSASRTITVYGVAATWGETTLTWNNAPANGTQVASFSASNTAGVWYSIDVTSYVQSQRANGVNQVSFALIDNGPVDSKSDINFATKEATTGQPQLVVTP